VSDLFPAALRQTKPSRPKLPSKHISAVFNPKIARPERIFEFDDPFDVLPPAKGMRPRPRMQRPVNRSRFPRHSRKSLLATSKASEHEKSSQTVVVEFVKHELPVHDEPVMLQMLQTAEMKRGDKVSNVRIISREFKLPERTMIFEGIASIEPGPKGWWQRTPR